MKKNTVSPDGLVKKAKQHYMALSEAWKDPIYPFHARHVQEVEKWVNKLLQKYPRVDPLTVRLAVWLHDIGFVIGKRDVDHAIKSEKEARRFLAKLNVDKDRIDQVCHAVRAHRNKDVRPKTREAKFLAAADSASHLTDIVMYVTLVSQGLKTYALEKIERDWRDTALLPGLQEQITPLYRAWKQLLQEYEKISL